MTLSTFLEPLFKVRKERSWSCFPLRENHQSCNGRVVKFLLPALKFRPELAHTAYRTAQDTLHWTLTNICGSILLGFWHLFLLFLKCAPLRRVRHMILGYSTQTYNSKLFQAHTGGVYNKPNSRICLKQEKPHKPQSLRPKKMGRSKALVCDSDS